MKIELRGQDNFYFFTDISEQNALIALPWGDAEFDVSLCIMDQSLISSPSVKDTIDNLVLMNTDWFEVLGPKSEWLHDEIDLASVRLGRQQAVGDGSPMTGWDEEALTVEDMADGALYGFVGSENRLVVVIGDAADLERIVKEVIKQNFIDLKDSLLILSAPATKQIEYFQGLGLSPMADELALEFGGVIGWLDSFVAEKMLTTEASQLIKRLDSMLNGMSDNKELWSFEALKTSPEWEGVRQLAKKALGEIGPDSIVLPGKDLVSLVSQLYSSMPEFVEWNSDFDEDLPYVVFGSFAIFLCNEILKAEPDDEMLQRAFNFLNEMVDSGDPKILNLLTVGVLEIFLDHEEVYNYAMKALSANGKKWLEEIKSFWKKGN